MMRFSIIVPVYNVEQYLRECLESIIAQTYDNYEVLLINDGSTDDSGLICEEYSANNCNIKVIHKVNGGLSDARNVGIHNSKGEYIIFVDSDDTIEADTLSLFNNHLIDSNNPDVLVTRIKKIYQVSNIVKYMDEDLQLNSFNNLSKNDVITTLFTKSNSLWPAVRYIINRSFIVNSQLNFSKGYLHEDLDWVSQLFLHANTFAGVQYYWYNHREDREGSITSNKYNSKRLLDVIDLVSRNINDINYNTLDEETRTVMFQRMLRSVFSSLNYYKYYDKHTKKKVIERLKKNKGFFKYSVRTRHKLFYSFSRVFGFKLGLLLISIFNKS